MKRNILYSLLATAVSFNSFSCSAIRFHPSITDEDLCRLGKQYPSVGLIQEKTEYLDKDYGNIKFTVDSTATLITLPNLEKADGSLVLVSNHALKNWNSKSDNFIFTLNGQESKVINYIPAPQEELSESFLCLQWSTTLQRDFGFALLETPIKDVTPSPILLDNFLTLDPNETLATVGYGNAGRLDSGYHFVDSTRRAMQTYISEYSVASAEGLSASLNSNPLRLEHFYNWDFRTLPDYIVRGSVENVDSGGPVFMKNSVIGVTKGSGYQYTDSKEKLGSTCTFDKEIIKRLKTNEPLLLEKNSLTPPISNSTSLIIESLGGASDWISNVLPTTIQKKLFNGAG
jgi:hypothetical protein